MCINRKTLSEEKIAGICKTNRFSTYVVLKKAKRILDQYGDVKGIEKYRVNSDEFVISRFMDAVCDKYRKTYVEKVGQKTGSLDYFLTEMIGTVWVKELIEKVLDQVEQYDEYDEQYRYILEEYYISETRLDDVEIQVEMEISRSTYYRRKRNAIILFGIILWNTVISECISERV